MRFLPRDYTDPRRHATFLSYHEPNVLMAQHLTLSLQGAIREFGRTAQTLTRVRNVESSPDLIESIADLQTILLCIADALEAPDGRT